MLFRKMRVKVVDFTIDLSLRTIFIFRIEGGVGFVEQASMQMIGSFKVYLFIFKTKFRLIYFIKPFLNNYGTRTTELDRTSQ